MDNNMIKDNLASNYKENSMVKAILVRWKWNEEHTGRKFLGLRYGGSAETQYDLNVRYPIGSNEKITLLLHADQLANLSTEEKKDKIMSLLVDHVWKWDLKNSRDFQTIVSKFVK
ncbi:MAG TPA: hypothetical protein GX712_01185 [Bacteroidales bacterium]|nr:hypothetical protein [Bacteroidales bacterium]